MRTRDALGCRLVPVLSLIAALAGCATDAPGANQTGVSPAPSVPAVTTPLRTPAATGSGSVPAEPRVVASGLDAPWDLAVLPDGSALITLRDRGEVVRVRQGEKQTVVGRIDDSRPKGEGGLLGLTLSPRFSDDRWVYLYFTTNRDNRVVRYRYTGRELTSPQVIISGIPHASNHNGGRLRFGPDGMLYITTGDVTAKPPSNAQDRRNLAGKILRVTPMGKVPDGNPYGNEVWSYGHRNVQGIAWDAKGRMFASEFGSNKLDELNLIVRGGNYGWPEVEGYARNESFIDPLITWRTRDASPSGIAVSRSGDVFVAALRGERLWRATWQGQGMSQPEVYFQGVGRIRAVELVGNQLWLLTNNTSDGDPDPEDDKLLTIPAP